MSKFKIISVAGLQRQVLTSAFYLLLMSSAFAWQNNIIEFQRELQIALCAGIAMVAFLHLRKLSNAKYPYSWVLDNTGLWQEYEREFQLSCKSRVSFFGIWVVLVDKSQPHNQNGRWFLPDQLSQKDFRRLSRVVLRCQSNR